MLLGRSAVTLALLAVTPGTLTVAGDLTPEEIVAQATPSLVLIEAFDSEGRPIAQGSGFAAMEPNLVITNFHVIRGACRLRLRAGERQATDVHVAFLDPLRDIALLRVRDFELPPLETSSSSRLRAGARVVAIGFPKSSVTGSRPSVSDGLLSGASTIGDVAMLQISAPISPGSSGGPVLNHRGQVIGIATLSWLDGQNLNFAVPMDFVRSVALDVAPRPLADVCRAYPDVATESSDYSVDPRDEGAALRRFHDLADRVNAMVTESHGRRRSDHGEYRRNGRIRYNRWWIERKGKMTYNVYAVDPTWSIVTTFVGYISIPLQYTTEQHVRKRSSNGVVPLSPFFV